MKQALIIISSVLGLALVIACYHYFVNDQYTKRERLTGRGSFTSQSFNYSDSESLVPYAGLPGQGAWNWPVVPLTNTNDTLLSPARPLIKPPLRLANQQEAPVYAMGNK